MPFTFPNKDLAIWAVIQDETVAWFQCTLGEGVLSSHQGNGHVSTGIRHLKYKKTSINWMHLWFRRAIYHIGMVKFPWLPCRVWPSSYWTHQPWYHQTLLQAGLVFLQEPVIREMDHILVYFLDDFEVDSFSFLPPTSFPVQPLHHTHTRERVHCVRCHECPLQVV